jgi:hypothetical protein
MRTNHKFQCLNPECKGVGHYARGLCRLCYISAANCIKAGETTWDKLVKSGKAHSSNHIKANFRKDWLLK